MADIRDNLPEGLLDDIELVLDVTWSDTATDEKFKNLIGGGIAYLSDKLGITDTTEFTKDGQPRMLLIQYVRYARDNALEVFESNFLSLILSAQHERKIFNAISTSEDEQDITDV